MKKPRSILFSSVMIQALLDGLKTQTRRIIDPQPKKEPIYNGKLNAIDWVWRKSDKHDGIGITEMISQCPYGKPGDYLWVREMHYAYGQWKKNGTTKTGKQKWRFKDLSNAEMDYRYAQNPPEALKKGHSEELGYYKRPSLFMPRKACRLFLKIITVRAEELQSITEADAIAEGCLLDADGFPAEQDHKSGIGSIGWDDATEWYAWLWEEINGDESWLSNPWVWAVEFEPVIDPSIFN